MRLTMVKPPTVANERYRFMAGPVPERGRAGKSAAEFIRRLVYQWSPYVVLI